MPAQPSFELDSPFSLSTDVYAVPFGMESSMGSQLSKAFRVVVEHLFPDGSSKKVNGIKMVPPPDGKDPALSVDELCQYLLAIAHRHLEETGTEEPVYRFRLQYRDAANEIAHKLYKFTAKASGDSSVSDKDRRGASAYVANEADSLMEYQQRSWMAQQKHHADTSSMMMRQLETTLNTILRANSSVLLEQRLMNEENRKALKEARDQTSAAQDRLFKMAIALTANNEHQEALQSKSMEMFSMGWSWYMGSMNQQLQMQEKRHRDEIDRLREHKKADNKLDWLKDFGPPVLSFAGAILNKMGIPLGELLREAGEDAARSAGAGDAPASNFTVSNDEPAQEAEPVVAEPPKPSLSRDDIDKMTLVARAHRIGEILTATDWAALRDGFNARQFSALQSFVTTEDELDVTPALGAFTQTLTEKANELLEQIFTREQLLLARSIIEDHEARERRLQASTPPAPPIMTVVPPPPHSPPPAPAPPDFGPTAHGDAHEEFDSDAEEELASVRELAAEERRKLRNALADITGLGHGTVDALCEFGTIAALVAASDEEILAVNGVGPAVLKKVRRALNLW